MNQQDPSRRWHVRIVRLAFAITLILAVVLAVLRSYTAERLSRRLAAARFTWPATAGDRFVQYPLPMTDYRPFDMGVVDFNGDGHLDLFSTNHAFRGSLLVNNGQGRFTDVYTNWRLDQEQTFPGLADTGSEPTVDEPGLYLYWHERRLVLRTHRTQEVGPVKGRIEFYAPCEVASNVRFDGVQVNSQARDNGATHTTVSFSTQQDGMLALNVKMLGLWMSFDFDADVPLDQVYVGGRKHKPTAHQFRTLLRDRHGMAWADYNGDDQMDIYVTRGALMGDMAKIPQDYRDELLINQGDSFMDRATSAGLVKNASRGRGVTAVDFDNDGRLDIYVSCQKGPDQLHRQAADGTFTDVAPKLGLDRVQTDGFVWFDADGDGDADLLICEKQQLRLFVNEGGQFQDRLLGEGGKTISLCDFDNDGDVDVLAYGHELGVLMRNAGGGRFEQVDTTVLGLPSACVVASWVDFDNDGLVDLFTHPGDLYRQTAGHVFEATGLLPFDSLEGPAMCSWFDADTDGRRDLIVARAEAHNAPRWRVAFYRNLGDTGHWLQIDLVGPPGNRQAIGTSVYVQTRRGTRVAQVGEADTSRYSQGHYRLYFGLGEQLEPELVRVVWPDGNVQALTQPGGDRLLTIRYEEP